MSCPQPDDGPVIRFLQRFILLSGIILLALLAIPPAERATAAARDFLSYHLLCMD